MAGLAPKRSAAPGRSAAHYVGISLDTLVDRIRASGYPVERVANHRDRLKRFEEKLRALPEDRRQRSSLGVIESLRHPYNPHETMIGSERFEGAVGERRGGPLVPHLDRAFLDTCLADLRRFGLIPAPEASEAPGTFASA